MKAAQVTILVPLMCISLGCSSIRSTHVQRAKEACGWQTTKLHGIPTTLEVPHQFKVEIIDSYWTKGTNLLRDDKGNAIVTRSAVINIEHTREVFTVDFVKPGAGTLTTKADLNPDDQYFDKIDNKITDTTIEEITNSLKTLTPLIRPAAMASRAVDPSLTERKKVVAVTVVDVNDPEATRKIHAFLSDHLNGCTNCCTSALAPRATLPAALDCTEEEKKLEVKLTAVPRQK